MFRKLLDYILYLAHETVTNVVPWIVENTSGVENGGNDSGEGSNKETLFMEC